MRADRSTTLAAGWSFGEGQLVATDLASAYYGDPPLLQVRQSPTLDGGQGKLA